MTTAAVAAIKAALKTSIDAAAAANQFALPIVVRLDDSSASRPPTPAEPMDLQLTFNSAAQLKRTTNKVLDQVIIDANLTYRHPDNNQANLDQCHLVSEALRSLLTDFTTTGARIEQLLSPDPFDEEPALQGVYQYRIGLDLDVIRTLHAPTTTTIATPPLLTLSRSAVWDAIDNWTDFANVWTRKFKTMADLEELALHDPGVADLPAVAVTWGPTQPDWWVNIQQQWAQQLFVTFWLPADQLDVAEWRLLQLTSALYKSAPTETPGVSYIRRATGRPPSKNGPVTLEQVAIGRTQQLYVWRGQIALTLTSNLDPNA